MALEGYDGLLKVIQKFKNNEIGFHEFAQWMRGTGSSVGYLLDYEKDFNNHMDNWLEFIEYCYPEEDWYELGCSLGAFIEDAILNEPRPLKLPANDRIVREQFNRSR